MKLLLRLIAGTNQVHLKTFRKLSLVCFFNFFGLILFAQQTITGTVRSGDTPIPNVTVTVKGTTTSVLTNDAGMFSIIATDKARSEERRVGKECRL